MRSRGVAQPGRASALGADISITKRRLLALCHELRHESNHDEADRAFKALRRRLIWRHRIRGWFTFAA